MTDKEVREAAERDILIHGTAFVREWFEDGVLKREVVSPDEFLVEPWPRPKPSSDRMAVGE